MHQHSSTRRQFLQAATLAAGTNVLTAAVPAWASGNISAAPGHDGVSVGTGRYWGHHGTARRHKH